MSWTKALQLLHFHLCFLVCVVRISSFKEYVVKLHKVGSNLSMSHLRRERSVTCMSSRHGYLPSCVTVTYGTGADDARSAGHGYEVPVGQQDCKICAGQTFCIPVSNVLTIPMRMIHRRPDTGMSVLVGQERLQNVRRAHFLHSSINQLIAHYFQLCFAFFYKYKLILTFSLS